jgi:hypothetical protein
MGNLHARQRVDGRDRRQLERLCRYIPRPPVAQDRLEERPDGKLELALKSVWKETQQSAARLLAKLGLAPQPPPAPSRAPLGQLELPFRGGGAVLQ